MFVCHTFKSRRFYHVNSQSLISQYISQIIYNLQWSFSQDVLNLAIFNKLRIRVASKTWACQMVVVCMCRGRVAVSLTRPPKVIRNWRAQKQIYCVTHILADTLSDSLCHFAQVSWWRNEKCTHAKPATPRKRESDDFRIDTSVQSVDWRENTNACKLQEELRCSLLWHPFRRAGIVISTLQK